MRRGLLENRRMRAVAPALGLVFTFTGTTMLVPLGIALFVGGTDRLALFVSCAVAVISGLALLSRYAQLGEDLRRRDAVVVVVASWLGVGVIGALPFVLSGALGPIDALIESISGFTTTGASVVSEIEALPAGLLFWRSMTHWLGGMGILVLAVAVLPFLGGAGYQLFKTEAPALEQERLYPRILQTARALFAVYVALTFLQAALLTAGGMSTYDAVAHAFGTIATGGFSTRNTSVGAYHSLYVEVVIIIFMIVGSIPFGAHYRGLRDPRAYLESAQVKLHLTILGVASGAVALDLWARGVYAGLADALRYGTFQVTSQMTTTGFATADSEQWTPFGQLVLITVMFFGGCTGSTSGGIKIFRLLVLAPAPRQADPDRPPGRGRAGRAGGRHLLRPLPARGGPGDGRARGPRRRRDDRADGDRRHLGRRRTGARGRRTLRQLRVDAGQRQGALHGADAARAPGDHHPGRGARTGVLEGAVTPGDSETSAARGPYPR